MNQKTELFGVKMNAKFKESNACRHLIINMDPDQYAGEFNIGCGRHYNVTFSFYRVQKDFHIDGVAGENRKKLDLEEQIKGKKTEFKFVVKAKSIQYDRNGLEAIFLSEKTDGLLIKFIYDCQEAPLPHKGRIKTTSGNKAYDGLVGGWYEQDIMDVVFEEISSASATPEEKEAMKWIKKQEYRSKNHNK